MQRVWPYFRQRSSSHIFCTKFRHGFSCTPAARAGRSSSSARVSYASSPHGLPDDHVDQHTTRTKIKDDAGRTHSDSAAAKYPPIRRIWKAQSPRDAAQVAVQRFEQQYTRSRGHEVRPWLVEDVADRPARLDAEIARFAEYCKVDPIESAVRARLLQELMGHVRGQLKEDAKMVVYGSEAAGYALNTSPIDVDFSMNSHGEASGVRDALDTSDSPNQAHTPLTSSPRHQSTHRRDTLSQLSATLSSAIAPDWTISPLIPLNRPLLLLTHQPTQTAIQLVSNPDDTLTARPAYEKQYMRDIPHLWPLYALLKTSLQVRKFHQTYSGGMGSYMLLMLLAAFFQHHPPSSLHDALLRFLTWADRARLLETAISIEPPRLIPRTSSTLDAAEDDLHWLGARAAQGHANRLCLQDPREPRNDLGRLIPRTASILSTWAWIQTVLDGWLESGSTRVGGVEWKSPLDVVVMNGLRHVQQRRQRLHRYYKEKVHGK